MLDARGEAVIYLSDSTYDYALKDASDNPVWTRQGINAPRDVLPDLAATSAGKGTSLIGYLTGSLKDFLDQLTSTVGAALIQATPAFSGAIARTLAAFTEDEINSAWFGPDRTGASDASAAL